MLRFCGQISLSPMAFPNKCCLALMVMLILVLVSVRYVISKQTCAAGYFSISYMAGELVIGISRRNTRDSLAFNIKRGSWIC